MEPEVADFEAGFFAFKQMAGDGPPVIDLDHAKANEGMLGAIMHDI